MSRRPKAGSPLEARFSKGRERVRAHRVQGLFERLQGHFVLLPREKHNTA